MKILMVCLGNICRSPLAEGILKHKISKTGLNWHVDSAGTSGWHAGEMPDPRAVAIARKYGIDITYQRARVFTPYDLELFDLIYAMDTSNFRDILRYAKSDAEKQKVKLIMNEIYPNENRSVPDPYYDDDGFEEVFGMLEMACDKIIQRYATFSGQYGR
jgi:protein-tyrosine phosphatase